MERIERKIESRHEAWRTDDGGHRPSPVSHPPSFWPWLALLVGGLAVLLCAALTTLGAQRLDVFHAAFFDSCTNRAYQLHWQDQRQYTHDLRNDFIVSTHSFVLLEIWTADGMTLRFSRILPRACPAISSSRLRSSVAIIQ